MDRNETIQRIKTALKNRSGQTWSVTGGRGTAWGWIMIQSPPSRQTWSYRLKPDLPDRPENYEGYDCGESGHCMTPADRAELGKLLGLSGPCHDQGESIASSSKHYQEYVDRAEGKTPSVIGEQYWD